MHFGRKIKELYKDKKIRFLFVGGLNTLVGYGFYALFIYLEIHYLLAQTLSTVIGVIHSYFWNKYFTFGSHSTSVSEAVRFSVVYAVSYAVSLLLQFVIIEKIGLSAYIAGFISLLFTTLISYIGHNFYSFAAKDKKKDNERYDGE